MRLRQESELGVPLGPKIPSGPGTPEQECIISMMVGAAVAQEQQKLRGKAQAANSGSPPLA
jgi:hypothetical protein